jgi:exonuclease SbcC
MLIVALELENVKSYERARITFTEGVNAIVGHNGAGKSTIIEAIGYALFDALPYTVKEFVREGAATGSIAVLFRSDYDERLYRVERRFGGGNAYFVYDEELKLKICDGKADVLAFVRRHTLADPSVDLTRLFNDALGVAQGTLTAAFLDPPAKRKPIFDALLQVDDYSTAFERLREPVRRLEERLAEMERELAILATRLEELPALEQKTAQRSHEIAEAEKTRLSLEERLQKLQEQRSLLEAQKAVIDARSADVNRQEEAVRNLVAQRARAEQACKESEQAAAVVAAHQAGYEAHLAAQQERAALQRKVNERQALLEKKAQLDRRLALADARCQQLERELAEVAQAEAIVLELADAVQQQEALDRQIAALERIQLQAAELERRLEETQAKRARLLERRDAIAAGLARARALEAEGQTIAQQLAEKSAALEQMRAQLAVWSAEVANLRQQSAALENVEAALCPVCEQPLTPERRRDLLTRNGVQIDGLEGEIARLQERLAEQEREVAALERERTRLQQAWAKLPRAAELESIEEDLTAAARDLSELTVAREQMAKEIAGLGPLREALAALGDPRGRSAVAAARAAQRPTLEDQLATAQRQRLDAQAEANALEAALAEIGDLDAALRANAEALSQHQAAYEAVLLHRQAAERLAQRIQELQETETALVKAEAELIACRKALQEACAAFDQSRYEQLVLADRGLREELGKLIATIDLLRTAQANDEARLTVLRQAQAEHGALETRRNRLLREKEALENIRAAIKQAGPFVTEAIVRQVSEAAATIFGELMEDHSRVLTWGTDYGVRLMTNGMERNFRQLSGGEQMSAALAVRLALVREMSNLNIAFFDEPTANLDSARREALAQQIMTVRGFNQLFVISHDDTFEQATQNLIRVKRHGDTTFVEDAHA